MKMSDRSKTFWYFTVSILLWDRSPFNRRPPRLK